MKYWKDAFKFWKVCFITAKSGMYNKMSKDLRDAVLKVMYKTCQGNNESAEVIAKFYINAWRQFRYLLE